LGEADASVSLQTPPRRPRTCLGPRSCTVALPKSVNCQRATIQPPQGFDAQHGGQVFPVNDSRGNK
jgi:hypothetical protein